jgi:hypothetical protein
VSAAGEDGMDAGSVHGMFCNARGRNVHGQPVLSPQRQPGTPPTSSSSIDQHRPHRHRPLHPVHSPSPPAQSDETHHRPTTSEVSTTSIVVHPTSWTLCSRKSPTRGPLRGPTLVSRLSHMIAHQPCPRRRRPVPTLASSASLGSRYQHQTLMTS